MRVKTGRCRMPIGACSEFRDKDCGKFCYFNTVEVKTHFDEIHEMSAEEMAKWAAELSCHPDANRETCIDHDRDCEDCWLDWLKGAK